MTTTGIYKSRVKSVLFYLEAGTVATAQMIIENTGVHLHDIRRMITDGILTSSCNYDRQWLIATTELKSRMDHWGLYRHRIAKYSRTVPIFHIKRQTKLILSYLVSNRPWGLTEAEAEKLLGRKCTRALNDLVAVNAIQVKLIHGERIFLHRIHKKADMQIHHRKTNPKFNLDDEAEESEKAKTGFITYEEYCQTFRQVLSEMDNLPQVPIGRIATLLLAYNTNHSLRTAETWYAFNPRIRKAMGLLWAIDHTTLARAFDSISERFLKELFHKLVLKLHDNEVISGKFLVVDATHIYAYANTRKDTNKHPVEGADWGNHHGSFFGYKVHILIDAESELPISMILSPGNDFDSIHFMPLMEDFDSHYDFEEVIAVLADGAYDVKTFRKVVKDTTGGLYLPACNPRRSKILKVMKKTVKNLFDRHGDKIHSVQDGFRYLGQTFLSDFGENFCSSKGSKLVELIAERLHRPLRAGVERVFSRLKALTSFERPKTKRLESVRKTIWFCLIGQLVQAMTADAKGLPGAMRKRTALV